MRLAPSPFGRGSGLNLLLDREGRDSGSVAEIHGELSEAIEFVASHQEQFGADEGMYGSFRELASKLRLKLTP